MADKQENRPQTGPIVPDHTSASAIDSTKPAEGSPAVRFASVNEEIAPENLDSTLSAQGALDEEGKLRDISQSLQGSHLQGRRASLYNFEPVSLPASRVHSREDSSREASRYNTNNDSGRPSPQPSPRPSMHSPPITPAATRSRDAVEGSAKGVPLRKEGEVNAITPQVSPPPGASSSSVTLADSRPPSSGVTTRPNSTSGDFIPSHRAAFSIGPTHDSGPTSREASPSRSAAPVYSQTFIPQSDKADSEFAAHKRPPQTKNLDAVDQRFKFAALNSKHRASPSASSTHLPRSSRSTVDAGLGEKRHSNIFGHKDHLSHVHDESSSTISSKHGSMSELKRFLKIGGKSKRTGSPTPSVKSGTKTPPHHKTPQQLPFGDDHGLQSKYGKFGKVLGAGAGGSVRLMKRSTDNTTFAVKEFRARHSYETEKEYAKKVTAEFCVGSTLHHGNIIETLDIVHEKGKWYEVMEYAPYDLFAIVMTGKMSREEISCAFLQIYSGVTYLHGMGLAHRDLKLDNVVVNEHGIMKIIDFGSASVFRYPFETGITLASGIVGSDPYLAPEVYDEKKYDPQPTDVWSLAIIFCCMSLRRFPWKMPRMTDNSYKLFASPPSPGHDGKRLSTDQGTLKPATDANASATPVPQAAAAPDVEPAPVPIKRVPTDLRTAPPDNKPEVIKGPWRLLRLLPRESRHVIGQMLELDPRKRITLEEMYKDPWVRDTPICQEEAAGVIKRAPGHVHTLEPPAAQPSK